MNVKIQQKIVYAKKIMFEILVYVDCEILEYLNNYTYIKRNDSVITCDEIIDAAAKSYNNMSIDSVNKHKKYKMDYHISHTNFLVTEYLLLLISIAINYY